MRNALSRHGGPLKSLLGALALAALVFVAGCGGTSTASDPFVGTWRPVGGSDASGSLVVAKVSGGYGAFFVAKNGPTSGPVPLQRHGNRLVFPAQNGVEGMTFTYHPDTGRLTDKDGSAVAIDFEMVSSSTAHPTPQPPNPSPDQSF
jgi:hypothetical protein